MAEEAVDGKAAAGGKKSKLNLIIILLVAVGVLGAGSFAAWKYLKAGKPEAAADAAKKEKEKKAGKEAAKATLNLEPFLVNLADSEVRFVKATFRLGLADVKSGEELNGDQVFISAARDTIISILTAKKSEQILSPDGKKELRHEIQEKVNALLPKKEILDVYIVDFVVQL